MEKGDPGGSSVGITSGMVMEAIWFSRDMLLQNWVTQGCSVYSSAVLHLRKREGEKEEYLYITFMHPILP